MSELGVPNKALRYPIWIVDNGRSKIGLAATDLFGK